MGRPWNRRSWTRVVIVSAALALGSAGGNGSAGDGDWGSYGGDPGGRRYSALAEIDRANVSRLKRAWTYHTAEVEGGAAPLAFESTPLAVDGVLYVSTPTGRVIALDGDTGHKQWTFSPPPREGRRAARGPHRGVSLWESADGADRRILTVSPDGRLFALDARTGRPRPEFGQGGSVDLRVGVAEAWPDATFEVSSPPAIYRDLAITGSHLQEYPDRKSVV